MRKKILIDCDCVLADFAGEALTSIMQKGRSCATTRR